MIPDSCTDRSISLLLACACYLCFVLLSCVLFVLLYSFAISCAYGCCSWYVLEAGLINLKATTVSIFHSTNTTYIYIFIYIYIYIYIYIVRAARLPDADLAQGYILLRSKSEQMSNVSDWNGVPDSKVHGANTETILADRPRWAPCWPHELCYLRYSPHRW